MMTNNTESNTDREFEEGAPGTQKNRKNDPLTEYSDKEGMTSAKIKVHEPTAISRDSSDQTIVSEDQTGTDAPEALEEYRRQGMTKIDDDNTTTTSSSSSGQQRQYQTEYREGSTEDKTSEAANTVKDGAESTFDKLKAGATAIGKKVTDPDKCIEDEYNKAKSE
jgi:hypothetical protein